MLLTALGLSLGATIGDASPQERASAASARPVAIMADKLMLSDGRTIDKGVILIEGGVIRAMGAGVDIPADASVVEHKGCASAGMVALHGYTGSPLEMRDATRTVLPDAEVAWAFNPEHFDFTDLLQAGITSLVLTPTPQSLAGGASTVVKAGKGRILERDAHLELGFSAECLAANKFPTSYTGALAELDRLFEKPVGAVARAASGKMPVLFEARSRQDVARAIEFATRHKLSGAINGAAWAGELAQDIKTARLSVICVPMDVGEERRTIKSVLALAEAGVTFGFGLDSPWKHPASLRLGAALCVREGLSPAKAWKALSADAAEIAGVGGRIGRLERGLDADIVLWSGEPTDLNSKVEAVFIDGEQVFGAER